MEKQNDYRNKRNIYFKELLKSHAELENNLKMLQENLSKKISIMTRINVCICKNEDSNNCMYTQIKFT